MEMILATDRCAHKVQVKDKEGQSEAVAVDSTVESCITYCGSRSWKNGRVV